MKFKIGSVTHSIDRMDNQVEGMETRGIVYTVQTKGMTVSHGYRGPERMHELATKIRGEGVLLSLLENEIYSMMTEVDPAKGKPILPDVRSKYPNAKFVAMDKDSRWCWYENEPYEGLIDWNSLDDKWGYIDYLDPYAQTHKFKFPGSLWRHSLIELAPPIKPSKKPAPSPDLQDLWEVHPDANMFAMDKDGCWFWYEKMPTKEISDWYPIGEYDTSKWAFIHFPDEYQQTANYSGPWQHSLTFRPTLYDWKNIPIRYNHAATNASGQKCAFETKPIKESEFWYTADSTVYVIEYGSSDDDWQNSLEERPLWMREGTK